MADIDLETELDHLYALPLAEFTNARNELAKRLRAAGDRDLAAEVKALAKPSVTAWAVNALYHHQRQRFDALIDAATAVRAALGGKGDRRQADAARRRAVQALLTASAELLAKAGHAPTPANRQRISQTLEALAARDPASDGPPAGRLASDLEPQGFDVLASLAASLTPASSAASAPGTARKARRGAVKAATAKATAAKPVAAERLEAARRRVDQRQEELAELETGAEEAETAADEAVERHQRLVEEAAEAERRARETAKAAAAAKQEMAAAKAAAGKAKAARRRALSRLETARRQLERLEG